MIEIIDGLRHRSTHPRRPHEVFERGGAQGEGAGLGLAIAKAIASGIGERIELVSPREGRQDGFEARFIPGK